MKKQWYSIPGGLLRSLPQTNWHDWFAWYPVRLTNNCIDYNKWVWWKVVERKIKTRTYDDDCYYREKK